MDGPAIESLFKGVAVLICVGFGGWMIRAALVRWINAAAKTTSQAGDAASTAAAVKREDATADRWERLFEAVERRQKDTEKRLDECEDDRDRMWKQIVNVRSEVKEVKTDVQVLKTSGPPENHP